MEVVKIKIGLNRPDLGWFFEKGGMGFAFRHMKFVKCDILSIAMLHYFCKVFGFVCLTNIGKPC